MVQKNIEETLEDYKVDLICGGFPCQPISKIGKQQARNGSRWLWPEFFRTLCLLRPRFALIENVENVRRIGLARILYDLASLGYDAEWDTLPACAFGARHLRKRVFIIATARVLANSPEFPQRYLGGPPPAVERWARLGKPDCENGWLWPNESGVGRRVYGVRRGVDRLRGLGNACVPQVVEWIGRKILESQRAQ